MLKEHKGIIMLKTHLSVEETFFSVTWIIITI